MGITRAKDNVHIRNGLPTLKLVTATVTVTVTVRPQHLKGSSMKCSHCKLTQLLLPVLGMLQEVVGSGKCYIHT